jgi:hypothetical protein
MGYEHPNGRAASGNPLPGAAVLDELIAAHLGQFDAVPIAQRRAAATIERICLGLPTEVVLAVLGLVMALHRGQRP